MNVALRISDLQKLKFEDITKDNKIILENRKTGKVREIQLNNTCVKAIANLKKFYKNLATLQIVVIFLNLSTENMKRKRRSSYN